MKFAEKYSTVVLIVKTYLLSLSLFFCFRLILFFTEAEKAGNFSENLKNILTAFVIGLRFDIVISGYFLILPFIVLSVIDLLNKPSRNVYKVLFVCILTLFGFAFICCSIDIPYFKQFFTRLNITAIEWIDSPVFVFKMIVQEPRYWLFALPAIFLTLVFYKLLKRIFDSAQKSAYYRGNYGLKILVFLLVLGLIFVGIRGRVSKKSPIRVGTAYFSDNAFLNQLGLNPVFTFLRSYLDSRDERNKPIALMNDETAVNNVRQYLSISKTTPDTPFLREITPDTVNSVKHNVVIVIMESMSAAKMHRNGNPKNLTPFLDSLSTRSYYFNNIYTAGIHTFNGIFSTLFSFPAIFRQHPMKEIPNAKYGGISATLRKQGYSTTFFTTHDGQFDNMEGFLRANDFENIVSQTDYPAAEIKTTLGVPDDYFFRYAIPYINKLNARKKPFFVAMMTASDHGPFYIPSYFKPTYKKIEDQIVEYADWSIKQFIENASKQSWFKNTLFVFVADHGAPINATYDISLDYHHTPLIFYAPYILGGSKVFEMTGGQIDVFPTIMGILKQPYANTTLGIDLLKEQRPYIYFNDDDKFGVVNKDLFLIVRKDGSSNLYKYRNWDKTDYMTVNVEEAAKMKEYAYSNMQAFQYVLKKMGSVKN